jgi:DNA-directed RNA polymerase subunit RPC12/RpoP
MEDSVDLLLRFVRDRDAHCPACGHNVRGLVKPVCPECGERLRLRVGRERLEIAWLLVALAPSMFSVVPTALLLLAGLVFGLTDQWRPYVLVGCGLFSSLVGALLLLRRRWFVNLDRPAQTGIAVGTWFMHIAMFVVFLMLSTNLP